MLQQACRQQRRSRLALLHPALPAASAQEAQQEASLSSIPQGMSKLTRIDDALDQLLQPIRWLGMPWSDTLTELLRKHLNQNLQVGGKCLLAWV